MKNKLTHSVSRLSALLPIFGSGALIFSFLPFPFLHTPVLSQASPAKQNAIQALSTPSPSLSLVDEFFGNVPTAVSDPIVQSQIDLVSTRKAFPASMAVIQKHETEIRAAAKKYGVPEDVAIGVALLENGGSETAVSSAGALGVFQLMPGTARALGLNVDKTVDDRKDPAKNIDAGVRYLALNYYRFGDWGLATWAYHAGEGNVTKALQIYAKANGGTKLPGLQDVVAIRQYVDSHNITIHKLLSSAAVQTMTKKLSDDSAGYPYKVIATSSLFEEAKMSASSVPGAMADRG